MGKALGIYGKLRKFPGGKKIFSKVLTFRVPYFATIHPQVKQLQVGFCEVEMRDRRTIHNHLKSINAGALCTLSELTGGEETAIYERNQLDGFWSADDYLGFVNTFKYDNEQVTLDKYTIIEKERTRVVYNWLQYFSRESLTREFEESGFTVEAIFSDVAGAEFSPDSPDMAIVARKDE